MESRQLPDLADRAHSLTPFVRTIGPIAPSHGPSAGLGCCMHPIERARFTKGWTRYQLAQLVGTSVRSIYRWEQGSVPRPQMLDQLAKVLDRDPQDLARELWAWRKEHGR